MAGIVVERCPRLKFASRWLEQQSLTFDVALTFIFPASAPGCPVASQREIASERPAESEARARWPNAHFRVQRSQSARDVTRPPRDIPLSGTRTRLHCSLVSHEFNFSERSPLGLGAI